MRQQLALEVPVFETLLTRLWERAPCRDSSPNPCLYVIASRRTIAMRVPCERQVCVISCDSQSDDKCKHSCCSRKGAA